MTTLPAGWQWAKMEDVCSKVQDGTHFSPKEQFPTGDYKYITAKNIKTWGLDLSDVTYVKEETHRYLSQRCNPEKGDVLYIKDGVTTGIATVNPLDEEFSLLSSVALLKPIRDRIEPHFLAYYLNSPDGYKRMTGQMTGTAIRRIILKKIKESVVPVAPLPDQRRIVAEIEKQFTRLEAGVAALRRVQANLHRYRAAVLKAACEGRLVETDPGKWKQATIKELGHVKGGKRLPAGHTYSEEPTNFPYIRVVDFSNGTVALENLKYLKAETQSAISRYTISKHDAYISIAGTIGLVGVIPETLDGANLTENAAKICNLIGVLPKYLCCYLASLSGQSQIAGYTLATTQSKLALFRIEKIVVPLPPLVEQERIVAEVERRLSVVEELSALVESNLKRASRLRQSVLQEAFAGRLVK